MSLPDIVTNPNRVFQPSLVKNLLEELIDRHAEAYLEAYPEVKEFSNYEKSGTVNYYIGMVWTNDFERPNANQLRIRGSQSLAKNRILELDLSLISHQVAFFPGQIVAFQADPYLDRRITVRKFLDPKLIAPAVKKITTDDEIRLIVASGPFLVNNDQDTWKLFDKMIETMLLHKATHVVLLGPFVDLQNQQARLQFDTMWRNIFDRLLEGLHDVECQVYLVPSGRDILPGSLQTSYFYPRNKINLKPNVKDGVMLKCGINFVADPDQIDLGGSIYVDVTSAEVQFHLNQSACLVNKGEESVFQTIYKHIISHGIYPLYPAPADAAVDHAKLEKFLQLDRLGPHLAILPTRFNTSLTEVDGRLFVAMHKCTVKKHLMLITIPKLNEPIQYLADSNYTHQLIDLLGKTDSQPSSQQPSSSSCSQAPCTPSTTQEPQDIK